MRAPRGRRDPSRTHTHEGHSVDIYFVRFTGGGSGRAPVGTRGTCASRPSSCPHRREGSSSPGSICSVSSSGVWAWVPPQGGGSPAVLPGGPLWPCSCPITPRVAGDPAHPCPVAAPPNPTRPMPCGGGGHSPKDEEAGTQHPGEDPWDRAGHCDDVVPAVLTHGPYGGGSPHPRQAGEHCWGRGGGQLRSWWPPRPP